MDVFVGWFKRAFVQSAARLVAQLYTGLTTFNFNKVNTDATDHTGFNNVYAAKDDDETVYKKRAIRTVTWIEPVTGRAVCNHYEHGSINDTPSASPPLAIEVTPIAPFITVDGVYVANMNEGRTTGFFPGVPAPNAYPSGGVHIQKISGVDYIVGYQLRSATNGFEIKKYKTILDMNIDQESITAMPYDKSVIYTEDSNFSNGGSIYHDDAENGSYELTLYIVTQSRSLTCNEDGTKTIFFAKRRSSGAVAWADAEYYPIFELTDTETVFEVNEILQYENLRPTPAPYSDITTCSGGYTNDSIETRENCETPGADYTVSTASYSGTYTFNNNKNGNGALINSDFLGCSYDRFTNLPIVLYREYGAKAFEYNRDYTISIGGGCTIDYGPELHSSDMSVNWVFSLNSNTGIYGGNVPDDTENSLIIEAIGGAKETVCSSGNSSTTISGTGSTLVTDYYASYTLNINATQSSSNLKISDYQIVDLSSKLIVYEYIEYYTDVSLSINDVVGHSGCATSGEILIDFVNGTFTRNEKFNRYYLYANNIVTLIKDDLTPDTANSYLRLFNIQYLGIPSGSESAGCALPPVNDCEDETRHCISTITYTCS